MKRARLALSLAVLSGLASTIALRPARADAIDRCADAYESSQRERHRGALLEARRDLLVCSQSPCPRAVTTDCREWLRQVEQEMPTVVFVARGETGDVDGANVLVEDTGASYPLDGREVSLNPGSHRFVFVARGARVATHVVLRVGEKARRVEAVFTLERPVTPPEAEGSPTRPSHTSAWIAGGIAGAALIGFGVLGTSAYVSRADMQNTCAPRCAHDDVQSMRTRAAAADVMLGVAMIATGAAAFLFLQKH